MNIASTIESSIRDVADFPKPGIMFKDIGPLLANPAALRHTISYLRDVALECGAQSIAAIESRGFLFGVPVALELGLPFVPIRKRGKLPGNVHREEYQLEYGTDVVEVQDRIFQVGERVLIIDDVLATGGTALAAARLVEKAHARPVGLAFVLELGFLEGRQRILNWRPDLKVFAGHTTA